MSRVLLVEDDPDIAGALADAMDVDGHEVLHAPDGTSAAWYQRQPEEFKDLMRRTIEIHQRMYREWPELARRYREALPEITSPQQWRKTFDAAAGQQG